MRSHGINTIIRTVEEQEVLSKQSLQTETSVTKEGARREEWLQTPDPLMTLLCSLPFSICKMGVGGTLASSSPPTLWEEGRGFP